MIETVTKTSARAILLFFMLAFLLALPAGCTDDGAADEQGTEDGGETEAATLTTDFDGSTLCGSATETLEFATRRRDCWDPELPCTLSQDPPWIVGTSIDCASVSGSMRWEVTVTQTGKYETQLRALAGGAQDGVHCFAPAGMGRTHVANLDLDTNAEFALVEVADSECSNP